MTPDAWPSPDAAPGPLPRIEDLPVSEQGYDQEAVRLAFDSFYRHAAQLDASLRALESVEVFRRDADALRNDLRALRSMGLGGSAEPSWALTQEYDLRRFEVPAVVFRLAAEAALIVAVAVIAAVAHFRPLVVIVLMAAAFGIVSLVEWLAARGRFIPPPLAYLPPVVEGEPAPYVEAPPPPWGAAGEPDEQTEPEALTMIASAEEVEEASTPVDPWEAGPNGDGVLVHVAEIEPEADGEPATEAESSIDADAELAERAGLFRRRRR